MSKLKLTWNYKGFNEIRKSEGVTGLCREVAAAKYSQVSKIGGYEMEERQYVDRNGYVIAAREYPAISDNLKNNTLEKLV